ncbi:MAG: hypothetical protein KC492_43070 [Myxococcales bacterium]|nr:hypothetical protein [Myxococcales bacterium]MCB9607303.1 hypothetical protein [Polyangiaceae bacterium]
MLPRMFRKGIWVMTAAACLSLASSSAAGDAEGGSWVRKAPITAQVNGHRFHHVEVRGNGCQVIYTLRFNAPENLYKSPDASASYFRFRGDIELEGGLKVDTGPFFNRKPGARKYTGAFDTSEAGCWSKSIKGLRRVDIDGCRGKGCTLK